MVQTMAFTFKGDLYKVSFENGGLQPLIFHEAHDYHAVWSKDGKQIAFASNRYGNFGVDVMNTNAGAVYIYKG
jgi:tricorn protease